MRCQSWMILSSLNTVNQHGQVKRMEKDQLESGKTVAKLLETHPWIATNKQLFNKPGTDFDFSTRDYDSARQELDALQTEQKK